MDMPAQQHFNTSKANVDDRFLIKNADLPGVKIHERKAGGESKWLKSYLIHRV